jgi:hypothetical protein
LVCCSEATIVVSETNGCKLVLNDKSIDSDITAFAASGLVISTSEDGNTVCSLSKQAYDIR